MGLEDQYEEANGLPQPKRRESEERIPPVSSLPRSRTAAPSDNGSLGARDLWLRSHQAPNTTRPESRRIYPHGRVWPHAVHSAREALIRVACTRGRRALAPAGYRPPTVDCPPARFSTTLTCAIRALHKAIARTQACFNGCPPQSSRTARRAGGGRRGMLQMHYYVIRFRLSSINLWGSHSSCYICSRHQLRLFFLLANALTRSFGLYVLDLSLPLLRSAIRAPPSVLFYLFCVRINTLVRSLGTLLPFISHQFSYPINGLSALCIILYSAAFLSSHSFILGTSKASSLAISRILLHIALFIALH